MRARRLPCLALVSLAACAGGGADALPAGAARNAVLITLDTTRRNALGVYGCPAPSTPHLDQLAAESVGYEWCRAVTPLTMPSHASMMTGLYPPRHGVRDNGIAALPPAAVTLAERARDAGIETAAFVAALVLDRQFGLDQGFDLYDQPAHPERQQTSRYAERKAAPMIDAALRWLEGRDANRRFFLWVHVFDPHAPFEAEPRFMEQVRGHPYIAEVASTDHELGRLFTALRAGGHLGDTAVVVVADHGEDLMDHGEPNHASFCYDSVLRVPFLVRYPDGHGAGAMRPDVTSIVDVGPTLCEALALAPLEDSDGISLWRREAPAGRGVYFESYHGYLNYGWAPLTGWADAAGKYIHSPEPELYVPSEDRMERRNQLPAAEDRAVAYRRAIAAVAARPTLPREDDARTTSGEMLAALEQLGYTTAAPRAVDLPGLLEPSDRPAPATRTKELIFYLQAQQLAEERRIDEAVDLLEKILAENPRHLGALDKLGMCHVIAQRWGPAIHTLERRLAVAEGPPSAYTNLALAYEQAGQLEQALRHLRRSTELDPANRTTRDNLARVLTKLGHDEEARQVRELPR
jgi:tetratricopeptide (TPR) repeat protein